MLAKVITCAVVGLEGAIVEVEVDIAPGLLTASVYFAQGLASGAIIALFGLLGLVSAYAIQATFLKGKPIPALPPIAAFTLVGLLIIS